MNNKFRTIANKANKHAYKYERGTIVCTSCGTIVHLDEAFSDRGANLICDTCVARWSNRLNLTATQFVKQYVWEKGAKEIEAKQEELIQRTFC